jgi:hypothetical protein
MCDLAFRFFGAAALFPALLFFSALLALGFAWYLFRVTPENAERKESVSRWKIPGFLLGLFVIAWCVPHAMPLLPESLHKYLIPAMIAAAAASWFVLDHLFARALGGYMILTAHLFLRETFGCEGFSGPFSAALLLFYGTCGIVLCGLPYRLRDLVKAASERRIKWSVAGISVIYFLFFLLMGIRALRWF